MQKKVKKIESVYPEGQTPDGFRVNFEGRDSFSTEGCNDPSFKKCQNCKWVDGCNKAVLTREREI